MNVEDSRNYMMTGRVDDFGVGGRFEIRCNRSDLFTDDANVGFRSSYRRDNISPADYGVEVHLVAPLLLWWWKKLGMRFEDKPSALCFLHYLDDVAFA